MSDEPLKSAYELALERLSAEDRAAGVEGPAALTEAQKARIGEIRQEAQAKLAELDILKRDQLAQAQGDPEKIGEIEEHYAIDRRRIESKEESAVERVRRESAGS